LRRQIEAAPGFVDTVGKGIMGVQMAKRKRRAFTKQFKPETVRLVREGGRSIPEVGLDR